LDRPDEERSSQESATRFLPPRPAGPEPELGDGPASPSGAPASPSGAPAASGGVPAFPDAPASPPGQPSPQSWPPPPPDWQPSPPPTWQPPPPGWQPPSPGGWQPAPPGWGYPSPAPPDNGPAVAGFVLSLVAGGLLLLSGGLSSVISIGCAIFGIVHSRRGKRKVAAGETPKHAGLAQAGFIVGIVSLVLAVIATLFWVLIAVLAISDEDFRQDLEDEFDQGDTITAALRLGAAALQVGAALLR